MALLERIVFLFIGLFYGAIVSFGILRQVLKQGYSAVYKESVFDKPKSLEDPALGVHGYLTLESKIKIHYVASGPEDKPLMLLLHGFPEFWYSWRHQIREFQKDYRVVAIDQRGYGESEKPESVEDYAPKKLVDDIGHVIDALGYKSCILVGHDWGGVLAWSFAYHFPNFVDRLIIINAPASVAFKKVFKRSREQQRRSWYVFFFQLPYIPELYLRMCNFQILDFFLGGLTLDSALAFERNEFPTVFTQEEINAYKYTCSQPGALTPIINWYRAASMEKSTYIMEYQCPVLVIWGLRDPALTTDILDQMEKDCPSLVVKLHEEGGHFLPMEKPDFVNENMREWLLNNADKETS